MTKPLRTAAAVAGFLLAAPAVAVAQNAITNNNTVMRAGPGLDFPRIIVVPEDAGVRVHGCIAGYDWCDISWRYERGWVRGRNLSYIWNGRYVIIQEWGPRIGLPVIGFSVGDYWTRYYTNRPWYEQRYRWVERDRGRWERRDDWRRDDRGSMRRDEWRGGDSLREQRREFRDRDDRTFRQDRRDERRDELPPGLQRRLERDGDGGGNQRGFERRGGGLEQQQRGTEQRGFGQEQRGSGQEQRGADQRGLGQEQRGNRDEQRSQRREQRDQGLQEQPGRGGQGERQRGERM